MESSLCNATHINLYLVGQLLTFYELEALVSDEPQYYF